jgi:hypothetical protein
VKDGLGAQTFYREFLAEVDSDLLVDSLIGPIYYRLLMKTAPLTEAYVDQLLAQLMLGKRRVAQKRSKYVSLLGVQRATMGLDR